MPSLPPQITSVKELEEVLSRPAPGLVESMRRLSGDIMILGAGGKVGPSLAMTAKRAVDAAGVKKKIIAVDMMPLKALAGNGIETIACDMMDLAAVAKLPQVENLIFMIGRKFGSSGSEWLTWGTNVIVPYHVARSFTKSRLAVFSTGCVYPIMDIKTGGATEDVPAAPVAEYAMSCLGRERMFDYYSNQQGERVVQIRLNYAVELRYGVLVDIATKVWSGQPVDLTTGYANVIWQGDVCNQVLQSLELAASPPKILNITGPETFAIRDVALRFGQLMNKEVKIANVENGCGYLNNARQANALFGNPTVPLEKIIEWTAAWIMNGGESSGKPTHFETQNGKY